MSNKNLFSLILIGSLLGIMGFFSPGALFMISLFILLSIFIWRFSPESDKRFLIMIFFIGITLRIFFSLLSDFLMIKLNLTAPLGFGWDKVLALPGIPDSGFYTLRSLWVLKFLRNEYLPTGVLEELFSAHGLSGFQHIITFFYFLFGYSPWSVKLVNCLLGALSGIFIYYIAKEVFGEKVAKLSAIFVIFFPSLFLWSITNLKDASFIFLSTVIIWAFLKLKKTNNFVYFIVIAIFIILQTSIRYRFLPVVLLALLSTYILSLKNKKIKKIIITLPLIVILFVNFSGVLPINHYIKKAIAKVTFYHRGHVVGTPGSHYKILDEKYYHGAKLEEMTYFEFVRTFFKAWFNFIFQPFAWNPKTKLQLVAFPQMVIWYILFFFSLIGIMCSLRYKSRESLILLIYLFVMSSTIALYSGNIGTVFRHRDMVTPYYLIFSAVGLAHIFRHNIYEKESLKDSQQFK
jgi:hypothetical protein